MSNSRNPKKPQIQDAQLSKSRKPKTPKPIPAFEIPKIQNSNFSILNEIQNTISKMINYFQYELTVRFSASYVLLQDKWKKKTNKISSCYILPDVLGNCRLWFLALK